MPEAFAEVRRPGFFRAGRILSAASGLSYSYRRVPVRELEVHMIVGIAIAAGVVLVCWCGFHVMRKWRRARG